MNQSPLIKHFERNTEGHDYVVGDIHGYFTRLKTELGKIEFNPEKDRLFSVGDLVDRGPESELVTEWLSKPWFHAVCGNHDEMAIHHTKAERNPWLSSYIQNGGAWFIALPKDEQQRIADAFESLPLAMSVDTPRGLVGIVHADMPYTTWAHLKSWLETPKTPKELEQIKDFLQWSRSRIEFQVTEEITDLYALFVGHTTVAELRNLGNVYYIDTMGGRPDRQLTIFKIN